MQLLYQTDSYLRQFEARVTAVDPAGSRAALDRTAFYPGGAAAGRHRQPGVRRRHRAVTQVKKEGDLLWHTVAGDLPAGARAVTGTIDWDRRYALMRTHLLHVLCGVVWRDMAPRSRAAT